MIILISGKERLCLPRKFCFDFQRGVCAVGGGWRGKRLPVETQKEVAVFLQVFDLTDSPCLNLLVICRFISCWVFNFCLLEVTPLWTSPHSNWICHRNRTLENFIFFPLRRQAGGLIFLLDCFSCYPSASSCPLPPAQHSKALAGGPRHPSTEPQKRSPFESAPSASACRFVIFS